MNHRHRQKTLSTEKDGKRHDSIVARSNNKGEVMEINYNYEKAKWTEEENKYLLHQHVVVKHIDDIVIPGRTIAAIKQQLVRLNAQNMLAYSRRGRLWTYDDDLQLIELINLGKRYKEIAEITGRTQNTLRNRVVKLRRKYQNKGEECLTGVEM